MKSFYLLMCFLLAGYAALSQNEAGDDKVICKGGFVKIGGPDKGFCYVWDAAPGLFDRNIPNPVVLPAVTTTYKVTIVGPDFSFKRTDQVTVYVAEVKLVSPTTGKKVKYDDTRTGVLDVDFEASVIPDNQTVRDYFAGKIKFEIDPVGTSGLSWSNANGVAVYSGGSFKTKATYKGLPVNNFDFGEKNIRMIVADCSLMNKSDKIVVFYTALGSNHPGGVKGDPNWFYYYKKEEGGHDYKYNGNLLVSETSHGLVDTEIADNAYTGGFYIETVITNGQLSATGLSPTHKFYQYFIGVVAHERQHQLELQNAGPPLDADNDWLTDDFERNTSHTSPVDSFSARGFLTILAGTLDITKFTDNEVYAGGPVEQLATFEADTSEDWAWPGTNWP